MLRISVLVLSFCLTACSASAVPDPQAPTAARSDAARALFERGLALTAEGDSVRAEQYLAAALREGHDWRQALPPLLRVCLTGSRLRAGLNYANPYLRLHPDETWLRYLTATVYLGLGQPLRAREHLQAIRGKEPYRARTEYLLGQTEWEGFGNGAAAADHFREYLRVDPQGTNAREVSEWLNVHASTEPPHAALDGGREIVPVATPAADPALAPGGAAPPAAVLPTSPSAGAGAAEATP
jgi:tetratricopeptide (TPR) repeat protein